MNQYLMVLRALISGGGQGRFFGLFSGHTGARALSLKHIHVLMYEALSSTPSTENNQAQLKINTKMTFRSGDMACHTSIKT